MGYQAINPSIGMALRTIPKNGQVREDHLMLARQGGFYGGVPAEVELDNVEDGQEHELRLIWNRETRTLDTHLDGEELFLHTEDVVSGVFAGDPTVYYGFTAGGGSPHNLQYFCEVETCDADAVPKLSVSDHQVVEGDLGGGGQLNFAVTLSCPSDETVTVDFTTRDGTAVAGSDYVPVSTTLSFPPGVVSQHVTVDVVGDLGGELKEWFSVDLVDPVGAGLLHASAEATILSDDALVEILPRVPVLEGDVKLFGDRRSNQFVIRLLEPIVRDARVRLRTVDVTATGGVDYDTVLQATESGDGNNLIVFQAGETLSHFMLEVFPDTLDEGDETFEIELYDLEAATAVEERVTVVLVDDDDGSCPASPNLVVNGDFLLPFADGLAEEAQVQRSRRRPHHRRDARRYRSERAHDHRLRRAVPGVDAAHLQRRLWDRLLAALRRGGAAPRGHPDIPRPPASRVARHLLGAGVQPAEAPSAGLADRLRRQCLRHRRRRREQHRDLRRQPGVRPRPAGHRRLLHGRRHGHRPRRLRRRPGPADLRPRRDREDGRCRDPGRYPRRGQRDVQPLSRRRLRGRGGPSGRHRHHLRRRGLRLDQRPYRPRRQQQAPGQLPQREETESIPGEDEADKAENRQEGAPGLGVEHSQGKLLGDRILQEERVAPAFEQAGEEELQCDERQHERRQQKAPARPGIAAARMINPGTAAALTASIARV